MNTTTQALTWLKQIAETDQAAELHALVARLETEFPEYALAFKRELDTPAEQLRDKLIAQHQQLALLRFYPNALSIISKIQLVLKGKNAIQKNRPVSIPSWAHLCR